MAESFALAVAARSKRKDEKVFKKLVELFKTPDALTLAAKELEDAKRELLRAQSSREYAHSMVLYREAQIERLTAYIKRAE